MICLVIPVVRTALGNLKISADDVIDQAVL